MNGALRASAEEYVAMRRALGYKLDTFEHVLMGFISWCEDKGENSITVSGALEWATATPQSDNPAWHAARLSVARSFARHHAVYDAATQVPPRDLLPARAARRVPYIFTDSQIVALADSCVRVVAPEFKAATCSFLIGLLACTGMRISEACSLVVDDVGSVTLGQETVMTLRIRDAKFGKTRIIPVHPSTRDALTSYLAKRAEVTSGISQNLVLSADGSPFAPGMIRTHVWPRLLAHTGIPGDATAARPRPHDLRHTFATRNLIDWHRAGDMDVDAKTAWLATYLGHINPASTYWYLQGTPELMALAGKRAEARQGRQP